MSSLPLPSKMSCKKRETKRKITAGEAQKKTDDRIMNTNDSSIVSKRCVSRMYFPKEPDFYEPFVGKYVRRNPLINRGYWQRMHAIEQVVRRFLEEDNGKQKVVINLGCGYDPLPFQFWHRHASISENCTFVDVDYPQLIERKRDRMMTNNLLRKALLKTKLRSSEGNVYLRSDKYMALGCNLKFLEVLESDLRNELNLSSSSILFVAEVSVTYMPTTLADSVIRWASTLNDARFCLLEQHLPQGANHPFAKTMLAHFNKLHSPIHAVHQYPLLSQQSSRFTGSGWSNIDICRNLWDLWSDNEFTPPLLRRSLDEIEPFDEWEEFSLYAGHYFLLVASNTKLERPVETAAASRSTPDTQDTSTCSVFTAYGPSANFPWTMRRFGAAFSMGQDIAFHGGQGLNQRLKSMDLLRREVSTPNIEPIEPSSVPQARVCHTITSISDTQALLVGGRTSPSQALADCWTNKSGEWQQVEELAPPRFRHSSTKVNIPSMDSESHGVLVFGGKTSDGKVLEEWCIWIPDKGWRKVPVTGPRPLARFGAAISTMGVTQQNWGLLCGGMDESGTVLDDIWQWKIDAAPAGNLQLTFMDRTNDIQGTSSTLVHGRIGASLLPFGSSLLLIGGVSKKEILPLAENFLAISSGSGTPLHVATANILIPELAYPLLVGFSAAAISADEIVVAGGGAVCFAMGSFWNEGFFSIRHADLPEPQPWSVEVYHPELTAQVQPNKQASSVKGKGKGKSKGRVKGRNQTRTQDAVGPTITPITRLNPKSSDDFNQLVAFSKPVVLEGLDIGPCTSLWTLDYLKEKIGLNREFSIHECNSDRSSFQDNNPKHVKKSLVDFLDDVTRGSKAYLHAASAGQPNDLPTKLEDDFPTIAADFVLPEILLSVKENYYSSPLQISGPVTSWLHYDVLANLICQVRGTQMLQLYHPSDAKYLDFPPGGSRSKKDVLTAANSDLRHPHPHIAKLSPGDILFIPPIWAHTSTPSEGVNVAVNVLWKSLGEGYTAGKDVYGDRDLQAYENGRRDVENISNAFEHLPVDISKFYLDRLVGELAEKADKFGEK